MINISHLPSRRDFNSYQDYIDLPLEHLGTTWYEKIRLTRRQIKNDQPESHDFRRFLRQFWTDFLEILQRTFSFKMLTGVKISLNNI